jgi:Zn-dependent protease with chaperone function
MSQRPGNPYLIPLQLVSALYFPFLAGMVLATGALAALVLTKLQGRGAIILGLILIVTCLHIVFGLLALFQRVDETDELEIKLPKEWRPGLAKLVKRVAADRGLDPPDIIRLHALSLAHVYLNRDGQTVLAVGGTLIALLSQDALAGVIAHELAHLTGGDVKRLRTSMHWRCVMANLEARFLSQPWAVWNPLVWLIRLYHHFYYRFYFASERREEFLADSYEVDHVGEEEAATTTVLIHVLQNMPWANVPAIAERLAVSNLRIENLFAEQVGHLRAAKRSDWDEALQKALREETQWNSTHPCLKARIKPLGVKAKDVLPRAMKRTGEPATKLFANWSEVEKYLSKRLQAIMRVHFEARQQAFEDMAAIMKTY